MLGRILRKVRRTLEAAPASLLPAAAPLPCPAGTDLHDLRRWLATVHPAGAPPDEMARYCGEDFERFVRSWHMTDGLAGDCLELGANPYFTTMLLRRFRPALRLTLANYFGPRVDDALVPQEICFESWSSGQPDRLTLPTHHFNVEKDRFPFADGPFDVVLFCEIIEHLLEDPLFAVREIGRVLKLGGTLIVTTPNVARLEYVARLLAGENLYDPYSGYGPYGRHNREYTLGELQQLLEHAGFEVMEAFSADVHVNRANLFCSSSKLAASLGRREDLGQYLFVNATNRGGGSNERPAWLYRSFG